MIGDVFPNSHSYFVKCPKLSGILNIFYTHVFFENIDVFESHETFLETGVKDIFVTLCTYNILLVKYAFIHDIKLIRCNPSSMVVICYTFPIFRLITNEKNRRLFFTPTYHVGRFTIFETTNCQSIEYISNKITKYL